MNKELQHRVATSPEKRMADEPQVSDYNPDETITRAYAQP